MGRFEYFFPEIDIASLDRKLLLHYLRRKGNENILMHMACNIQLS